MYNSNMIWKVIFVLLVSVQLVYAGDNEETKNEVFSFANEAGTQLLALSTISFPLLEATCNPAVKKRIALLL